MEILIKDMFFNEVIIIYNYVVRETKLLMNHVQNSRRKAIQQIKICKPEANFNRLSYIIKIVSFYLFYFLNDAFFDKDTYILCCRKFVRIFEIESSVKNVRISL